jgi:DNA-binding NtrC family response regulator
LVVDDDTSIRETLSLMFRDEGYEVSEASNGLEAIQQMRATTEPMVVLLDMWMPHMGGEETLLAALSHSPLWARLAFIVITANPQRMSARMQSLLQSYDIPLLLKPFDIDALTRLVEMTAAQLDNVSARRA